MGNYVEDLDPMNVEDFVELVKMKKPRPDDYVVRFPYIGTQCTGCGEMYVVELGVLISIESREMVCPDCWHSIQKRKALGEPTS